ncbi:MAG: zinc finger, RING-type domain-containing protein [Candidatus Babeliales bacterium]
MKQLLLSLVIILSTPATILSRYCPFGQQYQYVPNTFINHPEQVIEFTNRTIFELVDESNLPGHEKQALYNFTERLILKYKFDFIGNHYNDVYEFLVDQLIGFIHQKAWNDAKTVTHNNNIVTDKDKMERISADIIKKEAEKEVNKYFPGSTLPLGLFKSYFGNTLKDRITVLITLLATAECPICHRRTPNEPMKIGVCGHPVHYACASRYSQGRTCPTCGEDLVEPCLH